MDIIPGPLPSPAGCLSYSEYREKVLRWEVKLDNMVRHDALPVRPTSFFFRPFFDQGEARYNSSYPKLEKQAELLDTIINGTKDTKIKDGLEGWIINNDMWACLEIEMSPNPEFFGTKEEYLNDYVDYNHALFLKAKASLSNTNRNGFLTIKGNKFHFIDSKDIPETIYSPNEIGNLLNIKKIKHYTKEIPKKQQQSPEIPKFYQWCMYKAEPYEDKEIVTALQNAYESIPYLYLFNRVPPEFAEASIYGPNGPSSIKRVYVSHSKDAPNDNYTFNQLIRLGTQNLEFDIQRRMYMFAYSNLKSENFAFFENIENFYFFVQSYSTSVPRSYILARASFEQVRNINNTIITNAHNYFVEVSISSALYLMAHENKDKEIEAYAKTKLKRAENQLNSFISKEGKNVAEFFKNNMSEDIAAVFGTIIKCAINIDSSDIRRFMKVFPLSDFNCVSKMSLKAPNYFNKFTFLVLSSPTLHIKYLSELATNTNVIVELLNPKIIKFILSLTRIKGERIPDQMLYKCEWSVIAVSQLFSILNINNNPDAAELIMQIIKLIVRGRRSRSKIRIGDWEVSQTHITGLVASIIGDENGLVVLSYEFDAFAAMSREKNFIKFFDARERSILIIPLLSDEHQEVARIGFKLLRRIILSDTNGFINLTQNNQFVRNGIVKAIAAISVPNSIELIKLLYRLVSRLIQPERKNTENAQVGFLFAVVALPPELVSIMRLIQEGNFNAGRFLKALRADRWHPNIAAKYFHVLRFFEVMSSRKTAARMILNHNFSPQVQ